MVGMPHEFYSQVVKEEIGQQLGPMNSYGCGLIFVPRQEDTVKYFQEVFQSQADRLGFKVLGWRTLKTGKFVYFNKITNK
jgi:glutamate synthase (NADH)